MTLTPCLECDEPTDQSLCPNHQPTRVKPSNPGYDTAWDNLSRRARKLQPFCLWCNTSEDLQLDHTPQAWERKAKGLPIRLCDVRVLCRPCNVLAGQARPGPGQRTSEEKPVTENTTGPGRLFNPGGSGVNRGGQTPGVRLSLSDSPGDVLSARSGGVSGGPAGRLVGPW